MSWDSIQGFFQGLPYFIILIGVLIFVHEAGHFFFAKLFKVKVHVFSLGFGPKLLGFTRGETLYKISAVPIGGYVKMLGEDPTEEVLPEDRGRAFGDKPLFQRFLIIVGGPVMNLIFPFFVLFGVGLTVTEVYPAEIGLVLPEMPAHEAGLKPGDIIESIGGQRIRAFDDISRLLMPKPGQQVRLVVRRGTETFSRTVTPTPIEVPIILDEMETIGLIGVRAGYAPPLIGVADSTTAAGRAGLETFDLIAALDGKPISRLVDLEERIVDSAGSTVAVEFKRLKPGAAPPFDPFETQFEEQPRTVSLQVPAGTRGLADLGIESSADFVAHVTPGGAAEKIGLNRGDRLVSLDGKAFPMGQIFFVLNQKPKASWTLAWSRSGEQLSAKYKQTFIPAGEGADLGLSRDAYDKGFWGLAGKHTLPARVSNPAVFSSAFDYTIGKTWEGLRLIGIGFKLLFQGRVSLRSIGGPIMIGQLAAQAGRMGPSKFFWMMALISLNLGLINLFPIPVLDGGQIVFIVIESITRRPISLIIKERVMLVGLAMILVLMVFATWNDFARLLAG